MSMPAMQSQMMGSSFNMGNMNNTIPGGNPMMTGPMGGGPPMHPSMMMSQGGGINPMMTGQSMNMGNPGMMGAGITPMMTGQSMNMGGMRGPSGLTMGPGMMGPPGAMGPGMMGPPGAMGPGMMGPPGAMGPSMMGGPMGGAPFGPGSGQYMANTSRPGMTSVANPPIVSNNIQYGPSYKMQYAQRSTADKTAVKYTGFLPLEGVYEEDTCRIG